MSSEKEEYSLQKRRKEKRLYINNQLTSANRLFVKNQFEECIRVLKNIITQSPKNSKAYFMLGLVFEEMNEDIKAYNFFLIASQLMTPNYNLWQKLLDLSTKLNLFTDQIYFIQMLQRLRNSRELVQKKFELYKILKKKYKILETMIEFFNFDGVDFEIFDKIKNSTRHKARTSVCINLLIKYYKSNPKKCGSEFLMNIFRLQLDVGYLYGTRNLIEDYLLNRLNIPNDIRIIYILSVLLSTLKTENKIVQNDKNREVTFFDKIQKFNSEDDFTKLTKQGFILDTRLFQDMPFSSQNVCEENDTFFYCTSQNEDGFILKNETDNEEKQIVDDNSRSVTLNLKDGFINEDSFKKYSDLDIFCKDLQTWDILPSINLFLHLLDVLENYNFERHYLEILKILSYKSKKNSEFKEIVLQRFGDFYYKKGDYDTSLIYFNNLLKTNPDNFYTKKMLYNIYKALGNIDVAKKFKTISSLINYVDDIKTNKKKLKYTVEECEKNRELFEKIKILFTEDLSEFINVTSKLVNDFLENNFIFKIYRKRNWHKYENRTLIHNNTVNGSQERLLSLHGLDAYEWANVLIDYILAKIAKQEFKEVSVLLKKCIDCKLFIYDKSIHKKFILLGIKHSIRICDLKLLIRIFKRIFNIYRDLRWANFYFYLLHYFPFYNTSYEHIKILQNIRRLFIRNKICLQGSNKLTQTTFSSLDLHLLLGCFFTRVIAIKSYRIINNIQLDSSFNNKMIYNLILIITYKSRRNEQKKEMLRKGVEGLKDLIQDASEEEKYNITFNIGVVYHLLGYVGIAEKYYKSAILSNNTELKRLGRLSLIMIYKKSNPTLYKKYYTEDEF